MKRVVFLTLTWLAAVSCFGAEAPLRAVRASGPIAIDGKLDEAAWKNALTVDKFYVHRSGAPAFPASAKLLYDDDALYIGFVCPTPPGGSIVARETKRDGAVHRDDSVEVMIDPNKTGDRYFHIVLNPLGAITDRYCDQGGYVGDGKWNGAIRAKAFTGEGFWSAEMRIPYSTLDILPEGSSDWGFNFCRNTRKPNQEASAAHGEFNVAGKFLTVSGIDIPLHRFGWEITPPALQVRRSGAKFNVNLKTTFSNLARQPQDARIEMIVVGPGGSAVFDLPHQFQAEENFTVGSKALELDAPGDYKAVIRLVDPVSRRVLKQRSYPVSVQFAPLEITLEKPHYRDAIFASQNLPEVVYTIKSNLGEGAVRSIVTGIRTPGGKILAERQLSGAGTVKFPVAPLPEGRMEIFARAVGKDGRELEEATHRLRKLPPHKGEVWLDEDRYWRVDGKRYFMIGEWNDVHVPGIKVSVRDKPVEPGGKFITGGLMWSSFPAKKSYRLPAIPAKDEAVIRKAVRQYRDNPDLFAYYLADEPEISGVSASGLTHAAEIIRDEDPYHPILISNDTVVGVRDYAGAGEINGLHPYPNPSRHKLKSNFSKVVTYLDQAAEFNRARRHPQTVAYLQQGFNYGDWGAADSRMPTYDEIRTQYLMSLILGGRGILTYNRLTPHYPELRLGMPELIREISFLAPVFLENDVTDPACKVDNPAVRMLVKKHDGNWWIFAVSTTPGKENAVFTIPALGGRTLEVVSEGRTVTAKDGVFRDVFDNFQVHIYTTAPRPGLKTVGEIEKMIADANAKRAKPGNLAFQMYEYDKLKISASSNRMTRRADSNLWHVTDGVLVDYKNSNTKLTVWSDNTPNRFPDWIELDFGKPVTMGRVVVYGYENSLRDYKVQLWRDGKYETVGSVKDAKGKMQEVVFTPTASSKVRIFVTAANGPHTRIDEIEVYAK